MSNYEESYKRYRQYRLNKYRYEHEQFTFPLAIILIGAIILSIWRYVLVVIAIIALAVLTFFVLKKHFSKQFHSVQKLVLSSSEALNGTVIEATIKNTETPTTIILKIPPKVKNGQKYIAKNVEIHSNSEKKKVNIHFTIEISD